MRQKESTYSCKNNQERGGWEWKHYIDASGACMGIYEFINLAPADKLKNEAKQEGLSLWELTT